MSKLKETQLVNDLITLARGKSAYKAKYPKNLLYWDGTRFWADCVNLYKALFNGRDIYDRRVGSFQSNLSKTGDCTEWGLLSQCEDISTDFSILGDKFECLYKDGHFGGYLGKEFYDDWNNGIVNCVECTPKWDDGIQFSYVDKTGRRFFKKGDTQDAGRWTHHGKPTKFVEYETPAPEKPSDPLTVLEIVEKVIRGEFKNKYNPERKNEIVAQYGEAAYNKAQDILNILFN